MPSIVGKRRGKHTYYYLVESARVDGKPRIVSQEYLGTAEEVMAKLAGGGAGEPVRSQHKRFGDLAAVWSMSAAPRGGRGHRYGRAAPRGCRGVGGHLYRVGHRQPGGGPVLEAGVRRLVGHHRRAAVGEDTGRGVGSPPVLGCDGSPGHRGVAPYRDRAGAADGHRVRPGPVGLVLDMTNFATYIDSANDRAPIAQRGKAKQKRMDLRLVGLALVVTRDGGVPVVSHAYPGDRPDVTQFPTVIEELVTRYRQLTSSVESLTVVYDAGQNSADNHALIEESGLGFVGSLPPSHHPDLLAIPRKTYVAVDADRYPGLSCVDTEVTALGVTRRAVLTHSATLHAAQSRGFDQTLATARKRLTELQTRLARGRTRRTRDAVEADIAAILTPRWVNEILTVTVAGQTPSGTAVDFPHRPQRPKTTGGQDLRETDPVHQPHPMVCCRGGRGVSFPIRSRSRIPSAERPPRGLVRADAPLDRPENPRPRLLQRPRA